MVDLVWNCHMWEEPGDLYEMPAIREGGQSFTTPKTDLTMSCRSE